MTTLLLLLLLRPLRYLHVTVMHHSQRLSYSKTRHN